MEVEIWLNACFLSPLHGLKKYYATPKTSMHITHVHVGCSIIKKKRINYSMCNIYLMV